MMHSSSLLKAALAAFAWIEAVQSKQTSAEDIAAYPDIQAAMLTGGNYQWESIPVQTA